MMDLRGPRGDFSINNYAWALILELATQQGWSPAGLLPPGEDEDFDEDSVIEVNAEDYRVSPEQHPELIAAIRSVMPEAPGLQPYFNNSGDRVTPEDARALADALERALPDIPDHDVLEHKTVEDPRLPGERLLPVNTPVTPHEYFSGPRKQWVRNFIAFCRQGGFAIW